MAAVVGDIVHLFAPDLGGIVLSPLATGIQAGGAPFLIGRALFGITPGVRVANISGQSIIEHGSSPLRGRGYPAQPTDPGSWRMLVPRRIATAVAQHEGPLRLWWRGYNVLIPRLLGRLEPPIPVRFEFVGTWLTPPLTDAAWPFTTPGAEAHACVTRGHGAARFSSPRRRSSPARNIPQLHALPDARAAVHG